MAGLVLIAGGGRKEELTAALRAVASRLAFGGAPVRVALDFADLGFAMAASSPARRPAPQTGRAADGKIAALVEGELINAPALAARAGLAPDDDAASIVAALYAREGPAAVDLLRGHCSVAIIDRLANTALAANDPLGLRPLYTLNAPDGALVVASSPAAVLGYPGAQRAIDPAGLADFLAFGYGLGKKTLFSGVQCLPQGSLIEWRDGAWGSRQYWRLGADKPAAAALAGDLEALRATFNATVVDVAQAGRPQLALALSGGMDSRAILSALMVAGIPVETLTHSVPGATDARISAELAHLARTTHHFYEVRGEDVVSAVAPAVQLTGGALVGIDAHPLCFLDDIAGYAMVALTGMGGALYKASAASGAGVGAASRDTAGLVDGLYSLLNYKLKPDSDFPVLVSEEWLSTLQAQPRRSVEESVEEVSRQVPLQSVTNIVFLQEYMRKYLTKGDLLVRRDIETRHPMVSRDLLAQVYHLPYSARSGGSLMRYIVTRNNPRMADLPYEKDGRSMRYPLTPFDHGRQWVDRLGRSFRRRAGLLRYRSVPSYRYGEWLRGPMRSLVCDVLLDDRALARPYWRRETVRRWVDEHMAGADRTNAIGVLLSLEMIARAFLDGPSQLAEAGPVLSAQAGREA
jgi:hypothetical protein